MPVYPLSIKWQGTVKAALLKSTYTPDYGSDEFYSDVSAHASTGTGVSALTLTNVTTDWSEPFLTISADNLEWTGVTCSDMSWIVIYTDTGTAGTSRLLSLLDIREDIGSGPQTRAASNGTVRYVFDQIGAVRMQWQ